MNVIGNYQPLPPSARVTDPKINAELDKTIADMQEAFSESTMKKHEKLREEASKIQVHTVFRDKKGVLAAILDKDGMLQTFGGSISWADSEQARTGLDLHSPAGLKLYSERLLSKLPKGTTVQSFENVAGPTREQVFHGALFTKEDYASGFRLPLLAELIYNPPLPVPTPADRIAYKLAHPVQSRDF